MSRFWNDIVHSLDPYVPGEQPKIDNLIKLNTNENPYGPSPLAIQAIEEHTGESLRLYPDPNSDLLKESIAEFYGLERNMVFVGNGSDEVLAHCFQALLIKQEPLLFPDITYSFYPVYCGLYKSPCVRIPLTDSYEIDLNDYRRANGGILLANPNAPTGRYLELAEIEKLLTELPDSLVVVDEAYIDFGGESAAALIPRFENLLIIQTMSKSRSLAGLRLGFAMGQPDLIDGLERVKNSFNSYPIDRLALVAGTAAMRDVAWFDETRKRIIVSREKLTRELLQLGFDVLPSMANFIFARHPQWDGKELSLALREQKILVRHFAKPRIDQFLRITVGSDSQCDALVNALRRIIG